MSSFKDVAQLINGPEYPNSVQWADDGTLAVAEGSCVGILHPGSLGGAQAFAAIDGFAQDTVIAAPGKPNGACIHFDMALSLRVLLSPVKESTGGGKGGKSQKEPVSNQSRRPPASSKAIAWSPSGAGASGGCLLATVTNDYRVIIFGPDSKLDPEWRPIFTVHEHLLNHLTKTKWKSIDAVTLRASGAVLDGSSSSDDSSSSSSSSDSSSSSSSDSSSSDSDDEAAPAPAAGGDKEEEVLRLRGGAGGSSDGEDTSTEDTEDEEEKQAPKKKQKTSPAAAAAKRKPAAAASKAQKQVETKPAPAPTNRRKPAAPQVAPAGDATDLGGDTAGPSSVSTAADAALTAKAVLAGIPPVEFHKDRLAKLDIADTVAKRFFELRRQQDPKSLPVYPKTSSHLTGVDKATLERATEEYSQVYGERLKELGFDDKKSFWQECRIALPRCWNKQRNVFLEGFEETIGMGLGPGGEVQEYEESDSEATESEEEGADGEGGRKHKLMKRRAAAAATDDVPAEGGADEKTNASPSAPTLKGEKKRKRVPDPVFQRAAFEYPTSATTTTTEREGTVAAANPPFTWRDLPPVNNTNRTTLKNTLIEGAVKRFFRLRAAEPAELLPTYPTPKAYPKGVDAWIIDRVIKEYMHAHAPAMAALQYDAKKFTGFFNTRLRQVWDRSGGTEEPSGGVAEDPSSSAAPAAATLVFLEETFDFNSDDVPVHPEGSGEGGLLGPVPIHDKVDPSSGKKVKTAPKPSATVPKPPAIVVVGGGSAGAGTSAAAAAVPAAAAPVPARTKGSGGSARAAPRAAAPRAALPARGGTAGRSCYGKDSLGGSQWWGGTNINSDVYERRLLSISAISVAWSPAVDITISNTTTDGNATSTRVERCSFLAVGTKEGSIWLWRCCHPAVPALPGSVEEESASLKERMALIGRLPGNLAWADTMKWVSIPSSGNGSGGGAGGDGDGASGSGTVAAASSASVLVLVAGTSDGAVTLWGTDSSALAAYSTAATTTAQQKEREKEAPMEKWNTLQQPDLTQVISIDACLRYNNTGNDAINTTTTTTSGNINSEIGAQLVVALGKSAGIVAAWTSPEFSSTDSTSPSPSASTEKIKAALQQPGQVLKTPEPSGLGSSSVTGVGLAAGGEMVIACTREGDLESWSLPLRVGNTTAAAVNIASGSNGGGGSNGRGAVVGGLQPRAAPVPCSVRRKQKESGFGSFGVAISPGGMFLAIPKNALPAGIDFVKQLQVWQRLTLGLLHLHRIAGPGAEVDGFAAAILVCKNWAARKIPAAAIWDAVNLCRIQEGLAFSVAEALETEFLEIQRDVGKDVKTLLPSDVSLYAWRLLKAAVTLRRVEAAAAVTAAAKNEALEIPHQKLLDRDQMLLLQRQLEKLLASSGNASNVSGGSSGRATEQQQQQLQRLLAADCVVANAKHKDLMIGLLSLAVKAYHEAGETPPGEANAFAIPSRDGGELLEHQPVAMVGGSASAALTTMFHEEGQAVVVHRCPATLEVSFGAGKWVCRGCQRAYNQVPEEEERQDGGGGGGGPPECVMCAGLLGPYGPDFLLIPPCI